MDVAALSLQIDSTSVVKATADLDKFSAASSRAKSASGNQAGSIAKLVASVQSMDAKLSVIVSSLEKMASASRAVSAANDNNAASTSRVGAATAAADAHIVAYTQHLAAQLAAQKGASAAMLQADAHVVAYAQHLSTLSAAQVASGGAMQQADAHVLAYRNSLSQVEDSAKKASTAIKFTAQDGLNASRQLADIGVTAASGMSPFLIAVQQGPQLLDILQNKAAMTGQTLGAVFRAAAVSVAAAAVPFLPLIALLALAAAGIAALTHQANDDSGLKKYTTAMGYSKAEVAKLNAVTVTMGDTLKAVFDVGLKRISEGFGTTVSNLGKKWAALMDFLGTSTRNTLAGVYAALATGAKAANPIAMAQLVIRGKGNPLAGIVADAKDNYKAAQGFMDDVVKQSRTNAQTRQNTMAAAMYDKPSTPKGAHKYDFNDLLKEAQKQQDELTKAGAQIGMYGADLARVTYEQDLFNKATEHNLKLTPQQTATIKQLSAAMAELSENNRHAKFMEDFNQQATHQIQALDTAKGAIGLTGAALTQYNFYQEAVNKALADHITLTDADREAILQRSEAFQTATYSNILEQASSDRDKSHSDAMRQLDAEREGLGLAGAAALAYAYAQQEINRQHAAGVDFADINLDRIDRQAKAYGDVKYAIEQQAQSIADSREVTKGFFSDWINGAREGQNVFASFADSAINSLNRIIDKLLDKTLNGFLDGIFSGSGGGLSSLFGGSSLKAVSTSGWSAGNVTLNALGGAYGSPQRFANGGTFTNTVVNTPTLFRFAKGAKMGEMGEAGPEAIMPLTRGPNGKLGVQSHGGGRPSVRMGDVHLEIKLEGAISESRVVAIAQQAGQAAVTTVRRDFANIAAEYETNGGVAS